MQKFDHLTGPAAPMPMANIDTDQIIPKQFLKTVEREGLGKGLFYDFRFDFDGKEKMLKGLDAIGETLEHASAIDAFEEKRRMTRAWAKA